MYSKSSAIPGVLFFLFVIPQHLTQGQHRVADAFRAGAQHRIGLDALQVFADGRTAFFLDCLYQLRGVPLPSVAMPGNFDRWLSIIHFNSLISGMDAAAPLRCTAIPAALVASRMASSTELPLQRPARK